MTTKRKQAEPASRVYQQGNGYITFDMGNSADECWVKFNDNGDGEVHINYSNDLGEVVLSPACVRMLIERLAEWSKR